jgi:hypothetical protein
MLVALGAAGLTVLLWGIGALSPRHLRHWTALDLHWYFFPTYDAFYGALRAGTPMLWNPYQLCGVPILGTLQGGFFYPPHVLYLLLPTTRALAVSTVLHLTLAAAGTALLARRAGISGAGALLAAAVFTFAGLLRAMQLWPYFLESCAWLPFGALAVLELSGRPARAAIHLAIVSGMSWLAGCPQGTVLCCYAWAALLGTQLVVERPPGAACVRAVAGFAAAMLAGVLLAAVALLPAFELARQGARQTATLSLEQMYPFGAPVPQNLWAYWLASGSPALLLTALGLAVLAILGRPRVLVLWGLVVVAAGTIVALGPATPLFKLYLMLPLLGWFRVPHRVLMQVQFGLAVLAAVGLDVAARLSRPLVAKVLVLAVLAAVTLDGVRAPRPTPPLPYRGWPATYSPAHREAYTRLASTIGEGRVWPFAPDLVMLALPPKLPTLTRLRSIEDYEPLPLRRQLEYQMFLGDGTLAVSRRRDYRINSLAGPPWGASVATRRRLLDLAAVRFMILPTHTRRRPDVEAFVRDAGFESRPSPAEKLELLENPHVLPRAFVTYRTSPAPPPAELLPILARPAFDPLAESWVEGDAGMPASPSAPARGAAATIVRDDPHVVEIDATLAAPGLVVLADTFYPGWTATVDGAPARILATNHLFRGVAAPAGRHRVRFAYRPRSLALGAALSLLTALGLAAGARRLQARTLA